MATKRNPTKDEMVLTLLKEVQKQKLDIEKASKPTWETNCVFRFNADSASQQINLQTITDVRKLREILAFLLGREQNSSEASETLGIEDEPFTWLGFTVKEWTADLVTRANIIQIQAKRKKLADTEAKLDSMVSKEKKEELELQAISEMLAEGKKK
jgi:hypothetical protein